LPNEITSEWVEGLLRQAEDVSKISISLDCLHFPQPVVKGVSKKVLFAIRVIECKKLKKILKKVKVPGLKIAFCIHCGMICDILPQGYGSLRDECSPCKMVTLYELDNAKAFLKKVKNSKKLRKKIKKAMKVKYG
tara:strand:+ start:10165 stop:10569 length:405 start_codon:yes stop_codon:yes gene_type:complete